MQRGTDCDLLWNALECPLRLKHEQTQLLELVGRTAMVMGRVEKHPSPRPFPERSGQVLEGRCVKA